MADQVPTWLVQTNEVLGQLTGTKLISDTIIGQTQALSSRYNGYRSEGYGVASSAVLADLRQGYANMRMEDLVKKEVFRARIAYANARYRPFIPAAKFLRSG